MHLLQQTAKTRNVLSTLILGDEYQHGTCGPLDYPTAACYLFWRSDLDCKVSGKFQVHQSRLTKVQFAIFEKIKYDRPPKISERDFFKQYFELAEEPENLYT